MAALRDPQVGLWEAHEVFRLAVTTGLAGTGLLVAWVGSSRTADLESQGVWLVSAVGALITAGLGGTSFLLSGFRRVYGGTGRLLRARSRPQAVPVRANPDRYPFIIGATRYHRHGCQFIEGKSHDAATPEEHGLAGRVPCGLCRP
jgi:hypothetical protein